MTRLPSLNEHIDVYLLENPRSLFSFAFLAGRLAGSSQEAGRLATESKQTNDDDRRFGADLRTIGEVPGSLTPIK